MSISTYKWLKHKHGFAIITLEVFQNEAGNNDIIESYSGQGWTGQGQIDEVSANGFDDLKLGVKRGLEYAFSLVEGNWKVILHKVEGIFITDTNATLVGYVALRAFFDKINYTLEEDHIKELEAFVKSSWKENNINSIPDFKALSFNN